MPKRTNEFQKLVFHVHRQLAGENSVFESEELTDRISGDKREVDVVVHVTAGGYNLLIGVECISGRRRADLKWVQEMVQKHSRLTDKLVLVARAGFTRRAQAEAVLQGVETYTLGEAIRVDWTRIVGRLERIYLYPVTITPLASEVFLETDGGTVPHGIGAETPFYQNDTMIGTGSEVVRWMVSRPAFMQRVHAEVPPNDQKSGECEISPPELFVADTLGNKHRVTRVRVQFLAHRGVASAIELTAAGWKNVQIGYGSADTSLGRATVGIVEREGQELDGFMTLRDEKSEEETTAKLRPRRELVPRAHIDE